MILTVFKRTLFLIVLLLVTTLTLVLWLGGTENGTRFAITTIVKNVSQLEINKVQGTLFSDLTLQQIYYADHPTFVVDSKQLDLNWNPLALLQGHLHIKRLAITETSVNGLPVSEQTETESGPIEIPAIPFKISLDELRIDQFTLTQNNSVTNLQRFSASAYLIDNTLKIVRTEMEMAPLQASASGEVKLQNDWPIEARVDWQTDLQQAALHGHLMISGNMDAVDISVVSDGAVKADLEGRVHLAAAQPKFKARGSWQKLQWPLTGTPDIKSDQGTLNFSGSPHAYQASLNAQFSPKGQKNLVIKLIADGDQNSVSLQQLSIKPEQGVLLATGRIGWQDAIDFAIDLDAQQLNPQSFGHNVPAAINVKLKTSGHVRNETVTADVHLNRLYGHLYQQPIDASGSLAIKGETLNIQPLKVKAGKNALLVSGVISPQQADLNVDIKAPRLETAWPTLSGQVNGNLKLKGSLQALELKGMLHAENLGFESNRLGHLYLDADYVHASPKPSRIKLEMKDVRVADTTISSLDLQGRGTLQRHQFTADINSSVLNLSAHNQGQWNGKEWLGRFEQLTLQPAQMPAWQLINPMELAIRQQNDTLTFVLPRSCLKQADARLCFNAQGRPEQNWSGQFEMTAFPLQLLKTKLPDQLHLSGQLQIQADISMNQQGMFIQANADVIDGRAQINEKDSGIHELVMQKSALQATYQHDIVNTHLRLELNDHDFLALDLQAGAASGSQQVRGLSGKVDTHIADLTFIDGMINDISKLQGELVGALTLSGNTEQPQVTGNLRFQNGQFEVPRLGTTLQAIDVVVNNADDNVERLLLNASLQSGEGKLIAQGYLDLDPEKNYPLRVNLDGREFQVSRLPEAEVAISPQLSFEKSGFLSIVKGNVTIDKADIELRTLPENVVRPSQDEVIIDTEQTVVQKNNSEKLDINIGIQFSDNVQFVGFGLNTHLAGKLTYIGNQDKQFMRGNARMRKATYQAYGQDLNIRRGEFVFVGPVDNPWVNIEAIRKAKSDNVTAVLNVTGPLKEPHTRIFTEPALPESEALAYLVTGNSLRNMNRGDANAVANAAFSYGVGQLSWISDKLGIDEFEFEQGQTIEDSAIRLGQYLNPDLYVGVSMGLFATRYAANLRYRLNQYFTIRTRAGETQRIDLKYHLQTD